MPWLRNKHVRNHVHDHVQNPMHSHVQNPMPMQNHLHDHVQNSMHNHVQNPMPMQNHVDQRVHNRMQNHVHQPVQNPVLLNSRRVLPGNPRMKVVLVCLCVSLGRRGRWKAYLDPLVLKTQTWIAFFLSKFGEPRKFHSRILAKPSTSKSLQLFKKNRLKNWWISKPPLTKIETLYPDKYLSKFTFRQGWLIIGCVIVSLEILAWPKKGQKLLHA